MVSKPHLLGKQPRPHFPDSSPSVCIKPPGAQVTFNETRVYLDVKALVARLCVTPVHLEANSL